jgi:ABC-type oligopeptide transport system ATPase subunit
MTSLLEVRGLTKHFPVHRGWLQRRHGVVRALEGVDLTVEKGECFAVVGESGSGKTTLARCIIRLLEPTAGSVRFDGEELTTLRPRQLRPRRRRFQMIFQDPYGSLNPRMRVAKILAEPLAVHDLVPRAGRPQRVEELLDLVGLAPEAASRYPHQFSGGQRQRVGIPRTCSSPTSRSRPSMSPCGRKSSISSPNSKRIWA